MRARRRVHESDSLTTLSEPGMVCPACGGEAFQTQRYPRALCSTCKDRVTDLKGRPVEMFNVSMGGGVVPRHRDDKTKCVQVTSPGRVLLAGVEYHAGEARFGGIVVEPPH